MTFLKSYTRSLAVKLGNTAMRRALASLIVAVALHVGGIAMEVEQIDTLIALMVPLAAAWTGSASTKDDEPVSGDE